MEADRGTDTRAAQEDRGAGSPGREGGPQRVQDAFALEGQPAPERARQEVAPAAGLFGAPTARDFVDSARRERDAERDGE